MTEQSPRVLVARCENYREDVDAPCTGEIRFRWGMSQSDPCDVCGSRCGVAVAAWERVEPAGAVPDTGHPTAPEVVAVVTAAQVLAELPIPVDTYAKRRRLAVIQLIRDRVRALPEGWENRAAAASAAGTGHTPDVAALLDQLDGRHCCDARMGHDDERCMSCQDEGWPCPTSEIVRRLRALLGTDTTPEAGRG